MDQASNVGFYALRLREEVNEVYLQTSLIRILCRKFDKQTCCLGPKRRSVARKASD